MLTRQIFDLAKGEWRRVELSPAEEAATREEWAENDRKAALAMPTAEALLAIAALDARLLTAAEHAEERDKIVAAARARLAEM